MSNRKKALQWGAFFVACVLLSSPLAQARDQLCAMPAGAQPVVSQRVTDGDTLRLQDGRRVRLIGINAPELGRNGKPSEPYAQAAKRALQTLVDGQPLQLVAGSEATDRYGRTLGYLFDQHGENLEAQLLAQGMGYAVAIPPNLALINCHAAAEQAAREARLGLWQSQSALAVDALRSGGFQLVQGKVSAVSTAGGTLWVDLQGPLTLRFTAADRALFSAWPDSSWVGRRLELRGWLIDRQNWGGQRPGFRRYMLNVRHPSQIRQLTSE
ncbi:thermonuclease family protein [Halopseudomonas sp.]|uniref:thermonuclease family protein n=1 Tax=Halopseudomonas sp. TaxID=2901191 RepID=UPI0030038846